MPENIAPNLAFRRARPLQSPTPSQPPLLVAPTTSRRRRRSPPTPTPPLQLRRASPLLRREVRARPSSAIPIAVVGLPPVFSPPSFAGRAPAGETPPPLEEPWVRDRRSGTTIATAWNASGFFSDELVLRLAGWYVTVVGGFGWWCCFWIWFWFRFLFSCFVGVGGCLDYVEVGWGSFGVGFWWYLGYMRIICSF